MRIGNRQGLAPLPPHAYRASIIGTGIAPMGDVEINIIARVVDIEDCESITIAIAGNITISAGQRANVATICNLAIFVVAIVGDPANNAWQQDNAGTNNKRDIVIIASTGRSLQQTSVVTINDPDIDTPQQANNGIIDDRNR